MDWILDPAVDRIVLVDNSPCFAYDFIISYIEVTTFAVDKTRVCPIGQRVETMVLCLGLLKTSWHDVIITIYIVYALAGGRSLSQV